MDYKKTFEDEGFIYELTIKPSADTESRHTYEVDPGYSCAWAITGKQTRLTREVKVTDDACEVIVFHSIEAAVEGAREFLNI